MTENQKRNLGDTNAYVFDIDGVLCDAQEPVVQEIINSLSRLGRRAMVYFVTGNNWIKASDLLGHDVEFRRNMAGIFCNAGDELRAMNGRLLWKDDSTPKLPSSIEGFLHDALFEMGGYSTGNQIEWRGTRMINFCPIGRNACLTIRKLHNSKWRNSFMKNLMREFPNVKADIGGSVSVDIHSIGADKSRVDAWFKKLEMSYTFFGDKTAEGGNDYPLACVCENTLTVSSPSDTLKQIERILNEVKE